MNPYKKVFNPKTHQGQASPWLLCPSKSFPGKFYYFNGSTGETAWCLSETDKNMKKGPIHRVTDKAHPYPEPFDPPADSPNTNNSFTSHKNPGNTEFTLNGAYRPSHVFGQAVFPKYVPPDISTPNFVWALTPMYMSSVIPQRHMFDQLALPYEPEPMFVHPGPSNRLEPLQRPFIPGQNSIPLFKDTPMFYHPSNLTKSKEPFQRQMLDETTQTYEPEPEPMFINSVPSNRFWQLKRPFMPAHSPPPFHLNKKPRFDDEQTFAKPQRKDEPCQTFVPRSQTLGTYSKSDLRPKSALAKASRSVENPTLLTMDVETLTLSPSNKVENGNELAKNDLRLKLVANKNRECTVVGEKTEITGQSEATKTQEGLLKKRVSFNFHEPTPSHSDPEDEQVTDQERYSSIEEEPHWYVVADTDALLSEWQCIEEFVQRDASCRLLVPHAVYSELESRSRGHLSAISARQLLRKLAAHENHIIIQRKPEYDMSPEDSILECCWSLLEEDCYVILVTNNKNLSNKAKSNNLESCTVEEIRLDNEADSEPLTFGPEKHKQSINYQNNVDNNNQNQISVPKSIGTIDEIDLDINRLNMMEHNPKKSRDSIRVSGITKLNKQFNLDEELQRFIVKNSVIESRIKNRIDEWGCRLNQTMEGALTYILLNEKANFKRMTPPWNLFEALQVTAKTYKKHNNLKQIIGQFSIALSLSSNNGQIKKDIKPNEFLKLVGFSVILIEHLIKIVNCKELYEADEMLHDLIKNIEDPKTDIDLSLNKEQTPIFRGSDISDSKSPIGFRQSRTEIIEYLRKHFEAWQSENMEETADVIHNEPIVLITSGKKLNTLKINNTRAITVENNTEKTISNTQIDKEKNSEVNVNNQPKVIKNVKIIAAFKERIKNRAQLDLDVFDSNKEKNTEKVNVNNQPKVIRNAKIIEACQERIKNRAQLDLDEFDSNKEKNTVKVNVNNEPKVIRNAKVIEAFEKRIKNRAQLHLDEFDSNKEKNTEEFDSNKEKNTEEVNVNNQPKVIRNAKIIEACQERIKNRAQLDLDEFDSNKEKNTEEINVNDQPKVIRNAKIIEAFEERIKNRAQLDLDEFDSNKEKNTEEVNVINQPKVIRNAKIIEAFEERIKNRAQLDLDEFDSNKEKNTEEINVNDQPKVIRNTKIIETFEERLKNRAQLDIDELDYEDNESVYTKSDKTEIKSDKLDSLEHNSILQDLSVSESSVDTAECIRAYPLAKIFLAKVKATLMRVYNFIDTSIHEYKEDMSKERKADMKFKTELSRKHMLKIAERLKNIIARESGNGITLKKVLIKAGRGVEEDVVMANYKESVTKFLQQAQILVECLEQMLPYFNAASSKESDRKYCNSFDIRSPILPTRLRSNVGRTRTH